MSSHLRPARAYLASHCGSGLIGSSQIKGRAASDEESRFMAYFWQICLPCKRPICGKLPNADAPDPVFASHDEDAAARDHRSI